MTSERSKEPRSEPEIIPPGQAARGGPRMRVGFDAHERVYFGKPPPLSILLVVLVTGLLSAVMLVFLLGAFLIALPFVVLFVTAAIAVGILRVYFQR
jgi:hypothetical protein